MGGADAPSLVEVEGGARISVQEGEGLHLQLNARVEHNPDNVYKVLTDPNAASVFRSIQACTNRVVLEEDKKRGTRKLAVSHRAISRFLFISVTFETHLHVWEDDRQRSIRFKNSREGFMKKFEGSWDIRPFNQHSLDLATTAAPHPPAPPAAATPPGGAQAWHPHAPAWLNPTAVMAAAQRFLPVTPSTISLVTLEQHILVKAQPPSPIRSLIKRLVSKQLKDMVEDLNKELERRAKIKQGTEQGGRHTSKVASDSSKVSSASSKGSCASSKACVGVPATTGTASITASQPLWGDLWCHTQPLVDITIRL